MSLIDSLYFPSISRHDIIYYKPHLKLFNYENYPFREAEEQPSKFLIFVDGAIVESFSNPGEQIHIGHQSDRLAFREMGARSGSRMVLYTNGDQSDIIYFGNGYYYSVLKDELRTLAKPLPDCTLKIGMPFTIQELGLETSPVDLMLIPVDLGAISYLGNVGTPNFPNPFTILGRMCNRILIAQDEARTQLYWR